MGENSKIGFIPNDGSVARSFDPSCRVKTEGPPSKGWCTFFLPGNRNSEVGRSITEEEKNTGSEKKKRKEKNGFFLINMGFFSSSDQAMNCCLLTLHDAFLVVIKKVLKFE